VGVRRRWLIAFPFFDRAKNPPLPNDLGRLILSRSHVKTPPDWFTTAATASITFRCTATKTATLTATDTARIWISTQVILF
jgi:hypothetical protein